MKPLTMSEEQEEMVERQVSLGRSFSTAFADLDQKEQALLLLADEASALHTKLAETEAKRSYEDAAHSWLVSLAASQAEVRELREALAGFDFGCSRCPECHWGGRHADGCTLGAALARPTSDTALRGLCERVVAESLACAARIAGDAVYQAVEEELPLAGVAADAIGTLKPAIIVENALGIPSDAKGAAPVAAEIKEGA